MSYVILLTDDELNVVIKCIMSRIRELDETIDKGSKQMRLYSAIGSEENAEKLATAIIHLHEESERLSVVAGKLMEVRFI